MKTCNCMPTLHHLTNIIRKQEVLNIVNIANLVPHGLINENQSTDNCTLLCWKSMKNKVHVFIYWKCNNVQVAHSQILSYADLVLWYKKESAMSTLSLSLYASLYMCLSMYVSLYISLYVSHGWESARMETSPALSYNRIEDTCFLWAIYCNFDIKIHDSIKSVQKLSMNLLYM